MKFIAREYIYCFLFVLSIVLSFSLNQTFSQNECIPYDTFPNCSYTKTPIIHKCQSDSVPWRLVDCIHTMINFTNPRFHMFNHTVYDIPERIHIEKCDIYNGSFITRDMVPLLSFKCQESLSVLLFILFFSMMISSIMYGLKLITQDL